VTSTSSNLTSGIYVGHVVHKRLMPRRHAFAYRVFALAVDVDQIDATAASLRLFARNRRGLVSFYDADHGTGDGANGACVPVADHIRNLLTEAGFANAAERIVLLCYPRLFGFVFNPLSVYFCHDRSGGLRAVVYEVANTFGERTSYVIPVDRTPSEHVGGGVVHQVCAKSMYVSPFVSRAAQYSFHLSPPRDSVVVGVAVRGADGPVLKTHFRGERLPLTDRTLASVVARHPLMTAKVVGAIHFEAARLWLKGVPLVKRHASARHSVSVVQPAKPGSGPGTVQRTVPGIIHV
jgi:uncharacterized protein